MQVMLVRASSFAGKGDSSRSNNDSGFKDAGNIMEVIMIMMLVR